MRYAIACWLLSCLLWTLPAECQTPRKMRMGARAYALKTKTAMGKHPQVGIVAADPRVLPMGSRIRVSDAGRYNGIYTVGDTGATVKGHEIDIHVKTPAEARRFGRKKVTVEVVALGKR